jgi:hypothetical protein
MNKHISVILAFVLVVQTALPSYAQSSATTQTKAIQMCFDKLLGKTFAPENLEKFNLGEGKYLDQLAATKALIVWSLGEDIDTFIFSKHMSRMKNTLKISGSIFGSALLIVADSLAKDSFRNIGVNELVYRLALAVLLSSTLSFAVAMVIHDTEKPFLHDIFGSESSQDLYAGIADMDGENADLIRKQIIKGCNVIADQVDHYTKNPDLLVSDLETMRKNYSPAVLRDSSDVFKDSILFVPLPSQKKIVQTPLQKSKP